ncbi:hypothetical protein BH11BAC6_BH11BAC6_12870 [soil metagenome]
MCNFSIKFDSNVHHIISRAKDAINGAGGNFEGNEETGGFDLNTFMGQIQGNYNILDDLISINITKKPMLVPCGEIEKQLRKYLS